jgi:hypothetical protein
MLMAAAKFQWKVQPPDCLVEANRRAVAIKADLPGSTRQFFVRNWTALRRKIES